MLKLIVLPILLFFHIVPQTQAQTFSERGRMVSPASQTPTDLGEMLAAKEADLARLQSQYPGLGPEAQADARDDMQDLLYTIFDVSLQQKQWEARALRQQLDQAQNNPSHRPRRDMLDSLRQSLLKVEAQLQFREENRDRIVIQRLHELLP